MLRFPTALVFDAAAWTISTDEHGGIDDATPGRWVTVLAQGPVFDPALAGDAPLPELPADLSELFA